MGANKPQLCWTCKKACSGCCWSRLFIPVPNWTATPTKIKCRFDDGVIKEMDSFFITSCPLYEKEIITNKENKKNEYFEWIVKRYHISIRTVYRYAAKSKTKADLNNLCKRLKKKKENQKA